MKKKTVALLLALVLCAGCAVGGTVAWLTTKTAPVTNTFVAGNIGTLTLTETTGTDYMVIPGVAIKKDPSITFTGNNVAAYVFLKVEADAWNVTGSNTTYKYAIGSGTEEMSWTLEGWTKVKDGVYYKEVAENAASSTWSIIKNNEIAVGSGITATTIGNYAKTLTFTAYATQKSGFADAEAAWVEAEKLDTP